VKSLLRFT